MATGVRAKNISPLRNNGNRRRFRRGHGDGRTGEKYFAPAEQRKPPPIPAGPWRRAYGRKIFRPCGTTQTAADPAGGHGDGRTGEKYFAPAEQRKPPPIPAGAMATGVRAKNISPLRNNGNRRRSGGRPWRRSYGRKIFRPCGKTETAADSGGRHGDGRTGEKYFAPAEQRKPPPIPAGPWRRAYGRKIFRPCGTTETAADSGGAMATGVRAKNISPLRNNGNRRQSGRPWRRAYGRKIFRPCGTTETAANPGGHGDGRTGEKYFAPAEQRKPPPIRAAMATGVRAKNISPLRNNGNRRRFRRGHGDGRTGEKYFAPTQIREPSAIYGCDLQKTYDEEW